MGYIIRVTVQSFDPKHGGLVAYNGEDIPFGLSRRWRYVGVEYPKFVKKVRGKHPAKGDSLVCFLEDGKITKWAFEKMDCVSCVPETYGRLRDKIWRSR